MKEMVLGLAAGMIAGAVLVRNCKPCSQFVDEVTSMVEEKLASGNAQKQKKQSSDCEAGSDCNCGSACSCGNGGSNN